MPMLTHAHTKHLRQHTYLLCVTHYFRYDTCTCMSNVFALISIVPHYIHDCLSLVHTDIAVRIIYIFIVLNRAIELCRILSHKGYSNLEG